MRIAIDLADVAKVAPVKDDEGVEFVVVLTGPSGKAVYQAWQDKLRDQESWPQLKL